MSKKPKLREKYAYEIVRGPFTLFSSFDDARGYGYAFALGSTHGSLGRIDTGDVFILLQKKHSGSGAAFLEIIAPDGMIRWLCVGDRSSLRTVHTNHSLK